MPQKNALKFDLIGNALDSLNEGLAKYQAARDGDPRAFKFCILHLVHFVELYFKHCVGLRHSLLIWKSPHTQVTPESQTIDVYQALQILKNDDVKFSPQIDADIRWLKKLRNQIEHYEFAMDPEEVEDCIGRLMYAIHLYDEEEAVIDLSASVDKKYQALYEQLAQNYFIKMKAAEKEIMEAEAKAYAGYRPKEYFMVRFSVTRCPNCLNQTIIPDRETETGYRCTFCGEKGPDEYEVEGTCDSCGSEWTLSELQQIEVGEDGDYEHHCPRCRHDPAYVKDD